MSKIGLIVFTPIDVAILVVGIIWLSALSFFFYNFYSKYSKIIKDGKKDNLIQMLETVGREQSENKKNISRLSEEYAKLKKDGLSHIQKIGLVRFNPFKDTGGDQSFILALVDAEDTGVVISSLHTRTGTRWYAKGVMRGKGIEYDLSDEEVKALKGARLLSENPKL